MMLLVFPVAVLVAVVGFAGCFLTAKETRRNRVFLAVGIVGCVVGSQCFIAFIVLFPLLEEPCPWNPWIDTVCAPGFTEEKFQQIKIGMTIKEVEALLGPPLNVPDWNTDFYHYTSDGKCWFWDFAWNQRSIEFRGDRVWDIVSKTCHD